MPVRGVILDVDGTLLLSNDAHAQAWFEAFAAFGYAVPFERVRPLIGMGGDKLLPTVVPGLSEREGVGKQIAARRGEIFLSQYVQTLRPAPGARNLVRRMAGDGLHLVVASSAKRDELDALLKAAQVDDLLTETTTSDDADDSKPAPDIVEVALQKLAMPPDDALMIGDTPYDIESAGKAGVDTIAVRCGGSGDARLAGARAIYDDPADLLAHYVTSPLGEGLRERSGDDPHANQFLGA
jgi:HAD superfamily hydrolase (TIGR01509 family)